MFTHFRRVIAILKSTCSNEAHLLFVKEMLFIKIFLFNPITSH